jgi:hypothetical protein
MLIMLLYTLVPPFNQALKSLKPVFWLETIALWAFGISWLTKGAVLFRDAKAEGG